MGIYERDYTRDRRGPGPMTLVSQTAVGTLVFVNVVVWFLQLLVKPLTDFLAAQPRAVFGSGHVWKLVTANFAHDDTGIWHLAGNMFVLFLFGREIEQIYGRRRFYTLYFVAGILAVTAEELLLLATNPNASVLGASGAVIAVTVLFACHFPHRTILLFFFIPLPIWLLCTLIVIGDLLGVLGDRETGVANLAHLTGAAVGLFYRYRGVPDFRLFDRLRRRRRRRTARIVSIRRPEDSGVRDAPAPDPVSERIDALLAKISEQGKESLDEEEWEFLRSNSGRYRSQ